MTISRFWTLPLAAFVLALTGHAADLGETKRDCLTRAGLGSRAHWLEGCIIDLWTLRPVHPVFESLAPGSGFAMGLGFDANPHASRIELSESLKVAHSVLDSSFSAGASFTVGFPGLSIVSKTTSPDKESTACKAAPKSNPASNSNAVPIRPECDVYIRRLSLRAGDPEMDAKASLTFRAQHLQLDHQDYFGQGQFTTQSGWSRYSMRSSSVGAVFSDPLTRWLAPGFAVDYLKPDIGGVSGQPRPSIVNLYNEVTAPGLTARPSFVRIEPEAWLRFHIRPPKATKVSLVPDVTHMRFRYAFYHDSDSSRYSFRQFHGFAQTSAEVLIDTGKTAANRGLFSKMICPSRPAKECSLGKLFLTADAVISQTAQGSVVPFYFQPSLGGADMEGEDTLRGFRDYRFRAPSRVFYQAEFRHELGRLPMGLLTFYDVGRVGAQASDLTSHFRHNTGVGLYVTVSNAVLLRLYVGFGTGEGIRPNLKFASGAF